MSSEYKDLSREELLKLKKKIDLKYNEYKSQKLNLDMSRGKPCQEQLDLSKELYQYQDKLISESGIDCRNYGVLAGVPEAKKLFADLLKVDTDEIIIGGNSSLNLMYDTIIRVFIFGVSETAEPWSKQEKIKFLCPSPGYDRHFKICEQIGFEMITVPVNNDGPDMDKVEELVSRDESIKGIWCIPKYSNPTGIVYSNDTVNRLASMKTAADDFRIFWDNAYIVHSLRSNGPVLKNILNACKKNDNSDRVFIFSSTSKITYPGSGVSLFASSRKNINYISNLMSVQTIGPNKINQLLHYRFFKTVDGILKHMEKHAEILNPKFDIVLDLFNQELKGKEIASWSSPQGGYFINLNVMKDCAKKVVELAKDTGVNLTPAGATYPYGKDPSNSNIRIAPTFPPLDELKKAIEVICTCIEKASVDKLIKK